MTIYDQPKTTYSDQTAHARVISDVIQMIDPYRAQRKRTIWSLRSKLHA